MEHRISGSVLPSPPAFPALVAGSCRHCPLTPAPLSCWLLSASYQSKPRGDTLPSASLCLLLSLLLLLQDLSSFASTPWEESPIPGRTLEPPGAGDTAGSLSLPMLGAGAGAGQRCWAWLGARDVLGEGKASVATLSSMLVVQPCLCLSLAPAALPMVTSCLLTVLLFLLCFPFFSLFLNTLSALSDLALLFPAGWGAAAGRWTPGAVQGDLCITQREALASFR